MFTQSLPSFEIEFYEIMANIPLGIYFGLLPLSFAGIGTRDAAFIFLFKDLLSYEQCVLLGIFGTLRYIVPAAFGVPVAVARNHRIKDFLKTIRFYFTK